jgi:hypothetical protein
MVQVHLKKVNKEIRREALKIPKASLGRSHHIVEYVFILG